MTRSLRFIPILQSRLGAELCAWAVTLWSPGITGWTFLSILTSSRPNLCCIRCFRLGNNAFQTKMWYYDLDKFNAQLQNRLKIFAIPWNSGKCKD